MHVLCVHIEHCCSRIASHTGRQADTGGNIVSIQGWILSSYRGEYCLHTGVNIVAMQGWILSPYRDEYFLHTGVNIVSIQGWILSPQPLLSSVTPEVQLWQEPRHAEPEPPGGAGRGHGRGRGDQRRSRWRPGPASPPPPAPATARHQQEQVRPQDAAGPVTRKCFIFTFHSIQKYLMPTPKIFSAIRSAQKILTFTHSFVTSFLTYKNLQICLKVATFLGLFVRQAGFPLYRVWMRQNLFIFPPFSNILTIKCFYLYQKFILTVKQKLLSHKTTLTSTFNYRTFLLPQHKTSH